ncbi:class I SAM-dependent methyltransferase [Candidatus Woesearchaeota archaeon]|nr:class I SAM-dependent methyltransferase [Candidatus Woesearchaeota archaeon]
MRYQCPACKKECPELYCVSCKKNYPTKDQIIQFVQDNNTETWDHYWKRIPVYDTILDVLRKIMNVQLRRYLEKKISAPATTLEPGGGSAYVSAMLAEKGHQAYALDYAAAPLRIAREQLKSKATLVQGDLFNIPFADELFDLTFNNSTLEHFKNPLDGLKEMARVTKKGSCVFVGVPFTYGPLSLYKLKKSSFKDAWDGTTYDRKQLKQMFWDAGLEVVHNRTFFFRCFIGVLGRKT